MGRGFQLKTTAYRAAIALKGSGATWAVAHDTPKAFDNAWHVGLLPKVKSYEISGQAFDLLLSFLSNQRFL